MNFRSIDPRAPGEGMSGASETDRAVWREFYDPDLSTLLTDALRDEFARLWGATAFEDHTSPPQANATAVMVEDEALRLEELTLDELLARYAEQKAQNSRRPSIRLLSTRSYERNPLVIAIARLRASHRCEVPQCTHPTFETIGGIPYTEVHHIMPLAEGGHDTIENVVCLCPAHHREAHLGTRAAELAAKLRDIRPSRRSQHSGTAQQVN
jgi:5-methylcytosine-specific restriction endonuclease McrA